MPTALITGSNRGLGLEWTRQLLDSGWRVIATCRQPEQAEELQRLAQQSDALTLSRLDVTSPDQVTTLAQELKGQPIDWLINNAGVYFERWDRDPVGSIDYRDWEETFAVNTLGQVRVTEALVENLAASEKRLVVSISSHMGSIADIGHGRSFAYRSSKAALNAAMVGLSHELKAKGIGVLLLHPGWVSTRMGGDSAPYTPQESVAGMRTLAEGFTPAMSGRFYRFDALSMPW